MWLWSLLPVFLAVGGISGFWVVRFIARLGNIFSAKREWAFKELPRREQHIHQHKQDKPWNNKLSFDVTILAVSSGSHFFRFAMAVANGSVNITEAFPYISTCGAYPPQSCVFGQILNLGAFLGVVICFLKYQQVRDYGCHSRLNLAGLLLGILCALGASLVGNFQQYNQLEVHLTGAFLAFVVGILYFWVQTFLTNQVKPRHGGRWIGPLRFFLSFCGSALIISTVALFFMQLDSEAAYCEWALAMDLFLLFGLFVVDFWHMGGCSVHVRHRFADENSQDVQASVQTLSL